MLTSLPFPQETFGSGKGAANCEVASSLLYTVLYFGKSIIGLSLWAVRGDIQAWRVTGK
jgi:hypothetical protein